VAELEAACVEAEAARLAAEGLRTAAEAALPRLISPRAA
jgi:hypothetical protein